MLEARGSFRIFVYNGSVKDFSFKHDYSFYERYFLAPWNTGFF
jgi:hypothetical protein